MERILLIEPKYDCKYPPLGLMKIASYHKFIRNDFVWFSKGELQQEINIEIKNKISESYYYKNNYEKTKLDEFICLAGTTIKNSNWDRVYITTLFTYEWTEVINAIKYAKTLVSGDKIYTGGVMATLMESDLKRETNINVLPGLLTSSNMLGYDDDYNVDSITPDYSILDLVEYDYPVKNAYFTYMTRGCGMNCDFCAVQKIEPNYNPYISIKNQIKEIDRLYGSKKDLLLMDNNVLKSKYFNKIIDELKEIGYGKGATVYSKKARRPIHRFIDFNQGLDGNLINKHKAELLGEISLRPVRVAFDHIEDKDSYFKAVDYLVYDGNLRYLSNYILYNGDAFSGKGRQYNADSPSDLYNRLRYNVDYKEEFNKKISDNEEKLKLFCFPMRYRPLNVKSRGNKINSYEEEMYDYIGPNWCLKHLRAVQTMLRPTSGKGVTGLSFFNASFGKNLNEFLYTINMPERYIETRGNPDMIKNINDEDYLAKKYEYNKYCALRKEWKSIYDNLNAYEKNEFIEIIKHNDIVIDDVIRNGNNNILRLIIHYYNGFSILKFFNYLYLQAEEEKLLCLQEYIFVGCPELLVNLVDHFIEKKYNKNQLKLFKQFCGVYGEKMIIKKISDNDFQEKELELLRSYSDKKNNYTLMHLIKWSKKLKLLSDEECNEIIKRINEDDENIAAICNNLIDNLFNKLEYNQVIRRNYQLINIIKEEIIAQMNFEQ